MILGVTCNKVTSITTEQNIGKKKIYFLIHYLAGNSLHLVKFPIANDASFLDTVYLYPYRTVGK